MPCSRNTTATHTICYNETEGNQNCPITGMFFKPKSKDDVCTDPITKVKYNCSDDPTDNFSSSQHAIFEINNNLVLLASKDFDSLPLTTFNTEYRPCMIPWKDSVSPDNVYYHLEHQSYGCTKSWMSDLYYDPRYIDMGARVSLFDIQNASGVWQKLLDYPDFSYAQDVYKEQRNNTMIGFWARETLHWKHVCEFKGISREMVFEVLQKPYETEKVYFFVNSLTVALIALEGFRLYLTWSCSSHFTKKELRNVRLALTIILVLTASTTLYLLVEA